MQQKRREEMAQVISEEQTFLAIKQTSLVVCVQY